MEYRSLGRTGVKVSPLCLGCMYFGSRTSPDEAYAIVERSIEAGINFYDTANVYGRGRSEEVTGEAFRRNGKRHQIVLATKVHGRMSDDDPNMQGNSRRHIIEQCEASLKRLQTDYIDLYQIHRPQSDIPIDETLRALDDLVQSGKVRYIGTSTYAAWQAVESQWVSRTLGLSRFVCEQPPYNILDRRIERELVPALRTYGYGIIPWSPLAGGLLTGKYRRDKPLPPNTRYGDIPAERRESAMGKQTLDVIEALIPLAEAKQLSLLEFSLAWCMHQPGITSPIIGPRDMGQLELNLKALNVVISDEDRKAVDSIVPPGRVVTPHYEADFGPHLYRW